MRKQAIAQAAPTPTDEDLAQRERANSQTNGADVIRKFSVDRGQKHKSPALAKKKSSSGAGPKDPALAAAMKLTRQQFDRIAALAKAKGWNPESVFVESIKPKLRPDHLITTMGRLKPLAKVADRSSRTQLLYQKLQLATVLAGR